MRINAYLSCIAASLACLGLAAEARLASQPTQAGDVRIATPVLGRPLADRLLPDDKVILLRWPAIESNGVGGPDGSLRLAVASMLNWYDATVVIEGLKLEAYEPREVPGWVQTKVTGSVVETFGPRKPAVGTQIEFTFDGGELVVNGVVVRTYEFPVLRANTRQLVGLAYSAESKTWALSSFWAHAGPDGRLVANQLSGGGFLSTSLRGQPWTRVIEELRKRRR